MYLGHTLDYIHSLLFEEIMITYSGYTCVWTCMNDCCVGSFSVEPVVGQGIAVCFSVVVLCLPAVVAR